VCERERERESKKEERERLSERESATLDLSTLSTSPRHISTASAQQDKGGRRALYSPLVSRVGRAALNSRTCRESRVTARRRQPRPWPGLDAKGVACRHTSRLGLPTERSSLPTELQGSSCCRLPAAASRSVRRPSRPGPGTSRPGPGVAPVPGPVRGLYYGSRPGKGPGSWPVLRYPARDDAPPSHRPQPRLPSPPPPPPHRSPPPPPPYPRPSSRRPP
jgi:hypothetical protein